MKLDHWRKWVLELFLQTNEGPPLSFPAKNDTYTNGQYGPPCPNV